VPLNRSAPVQDHIALGQGGRADPDPYQPMRNLLAKWPNVEKYFGFQQLHGRLQK
jgi:hypothetical protein